MVLFYLSCYFERQENCSLLSFFISRTFPQLVSLSKKTSFLKLAIAFLKKFPHSEKSNHIFRKYVKVNLMLYLKRLHNTF